MWKWIVSGSALLVIGGGVLGFTAFKTLDALTAVPSDAILVVDVDLVELVLDLESERFVSTFGPIEDIWEDTEVESKRDPAETAANISGWAGPSLAIWVDFDGSDPLGEPGYCIDFSVIRTKAADAEIQNYLVDEGWDATERELDKGSVWETDDSQYIGRIGRIVFICEGEGDLVGATERALDGASILMVDTYESVVAETQPGPASIWINVPALVDEAIEAAQEELPETTLESLSQFGPAAMSFDIADEGIILRAFMTIDQAGVFAGALPQSDLATELPAETFFAFFTALTDDSISLIVDAISDRPELNEVGTEFGTDLDSFVDFLEVFEGDIALAAFETEDGPISETSGVPVDVQLLVGTGNPSARVTTFNNLLTEAGFGDFLNTHVVDGTDVTSVSFFGQDIVSWAARDEAWVIGGGVDAVISVNSPLSQAPVFVQAEEALSDNMTTLMFLDVQTALDFGIDQDIFTRGDVRDVDGAEAVVAMIAGARLTETGVASEWLIVMDW